MSRLRGGMWTGAALLVFLLASWRYFASAHEPWDNSIESYNNGFYIGQIVRNFDRVGWRQLRGEPVLSYVPGDGEALVRQYLHHPPFYSWLLHAATRPGGLSEYTLRLPSILATLLTAALIWGFVRRRSGDVPALFALLCYLGCPFILRYGDMVNYEAICSLLTLAAALACLRPKSEWRVAALVFLAVAIDWQGAFALASVAILRVGRNPRAWMRSVWLPAAAAFMSAGVSVLCFTYWRFGEGSASDETFRLATSSLFGIETPLLWWTNQAGFLFLQIGAPLVALSVWGMFARATSSVSHRSLAHWRLIPALVAPGFLNVFLFRRHSFEHPYWWQYSVAGFAIGAALGWAQIYRRWPRPALVIAALMLLVQLALVVRDQDQEHVSLLPRAAAANALFEPDDLMIRPDGFGPEAYYYDFWSYDEARSPTMLVALHRAYKQGRVSVRKIVYVLPRKVAEAHPELKATLDSFVSPRKIDSFFVYEW
ncbi:MAG: glycosyltransferase family 39 protein [Planctomycetota bacterium]